MLAQLVLLDERTRKDSKRVRKTCSDPYARDCFFVGRNGVRAYVGSSTRPDRNRMRLRDDQRTAWIENWRRWDIWYRRDLRGRNSVTLCGINAFGIAEIAKGLFSCAEQSRVVHSESPRAA